MRQDATSHRRSSAVDNSSRSSNSVSCNSRTSSIDCCSATSSSSCCTTRCSSGSHRVQQHGRHDECPCCQHNHQTQQQQRRTPQAPLLWHLVLIFMIAPVVMGQASALASSSETFFAALTTPSVSLILIPPDNFQLIPADWAQFNCTHPYVLERDVVIRSSAPPELGQMDFQFLMRKVLLAPNVTLTFEQLVLRNVNKLGGFGLDFFMGEQGSVIDTRNSVRVKFVCPPPEQSIQAARAFSAPLGYPANEVSIVDRVCVLQNRSNKNQPLERKCYDDAIQFAEYTLQVASVDPDSGTSKPGYRLRMTNVTRVCDNYVTAECIQQRSEDMCTAQLLSDLLAPRAPDSSQPPPRSIAGIVVGAVLGFLVVCCVLGVLLWKHKHCWANGNDAGSGSDKGSDGHAPDPLVGDDSSRQLTQQLLPPGPPGKKPDPSQTIKLGQLLGSGSFGRVFKGRWHGMDVAVKIIDPCNAVTLPRVLKEAEVMMTLNHANIVKAYQCSVWSKKQQEQMRREGAGRRSVETASPRKRQQQPQPFSAAGAARRSSIGSGSMPSSSTTASQAASSSSTSGAMGAAGPSAGAAAASDSIVINIGPEVGPSRGSRQALRGGGAMSPAGTAPITSSTSSSAGGTFTSSSTSLAGAAAAAGVGVGAAGAMSGSSSGDAGGLSTSAARRMFTRLWRYQQQEVPDHMLQGPSTGSTSRELQQLPRTAATPLFSAAYTLSGSSSMGATPLGAGGHMAAGVISSSTQGVGGLVPYGAGAAAPTGNPYQGAGMTMSSSSSGAGTSGALSSHSRTVSSGGVRTSSEAAGAGGAGGEIQPAPSSRGPVLGWLRRSSKSQGGRDGGPSDTALSSDSGGGGSSSNKTASAEGAGGAEGAARGGVSGAMMSPTEQDEMQVWLVLELCTGGSLKDAVSFGRITTSTVQDMARLLSRLLDAAKGLSYLHNQDVVHGDLKAANVLLQQASHSAYGQVAKISDFGVSARLLDGATHRSTTSLGTITHMAPEVLRSGRLSKAADVYAYGIMMWEVFTNQTAFRGCRSGAVVERVVLRGERPPVPDEMPPQYALLMQRCWDAHPDSRPTFEQVVTCIELLLDNLTSSDSDGRISEGFEEERTSSSNSDTTTNAAADKEAALAAAAAAAAAAPRVPLEKVPSISTTPGQRDTATASASASSSGRGLLRFLPGHSNKATATSDSQQQQQQVSGSGAKGLAESVEGSSVEWLSGPRTPGFNIALEQLRGIRQWYQQMSTVPTTTAAGGVAAEGGAGGGSGQRAGVCDAQQQGAAAAAQQPDDLEAQRQQVVQVGVDGRCAAAQPSGGYRSSGKVGPWLDQCVDALSPPPANKQQAAAGWDKQPWPYSRRWLLFGGGGGGGKLKGGGAVSGSAASSSVQQPATPHHST